MFSGLFGTCDIQLFGAAIPITAVVSFAFFMAALFNRAGHYIFALWFLSSSFFSCLFSSPNLSGRTLDVYHTSRHGVALVQI